MTSLDNGPGMGQHLQPFTQDWSDQGRDRLLPYQMQRLYWLWVWQRWRTALLLWLTLGVGGLWGLRHEFALWLHRFTWTAVRYGLAFNRLAAIALATCIGVTTVILIWQSRHILRGLPPADQHRLHQVVLAIRHQGSSHPLWAWVMDGQWRTVLWGRTWDRIPLRR